MKANTKELERRIKELISIPAYYQKYIDKNVDLNMTPKVCSPFRQEDIPSFSYSKAYGIWRDFGSKIGGDVIQLHRAWYKIRTTEEALFSLARLIGLKIEPEKTTKGDVLRMLDKLEHNKPVEVDTQKIEYNVLNTKIESLLNKLNRPDLYCDYDDLMSLEIALQNKIEDMKEFYAKISSGYI